MGVALYSSGMRIAGWLMLPGQTGEGADAVRLSPGWLGVEDGHIAEVVEGELPGGCEMGGEGFVVLPGLIDAHVHLSQFGIIGAHGLGLMDWLERVTYPAELAWADSKIAQAQAEAAIDRMLGCGTTGFAAYTTVHRSGAEAAIEAARSAGVRAHIGQVLMDHGAPAGLCRPAEQLIDESAALLEAYPPGERVSAAVTPRFAPTCSAELLAAAGRLAAEHGALIQTHLAETQQECEQVRGLFGCDSYTDVYQEAGLVTDRSVFGHGIYIEDDALSVLAGAGAAIAHCPTANRFLMSGRLNRKRALGAGVGVALGNDIGAGYEVSMVRVAREMVLTAAEVSGTVVTAAEAWHAVTAGNASALGWPDGGRIEAGCPGDLVVVEPAVGLGAGLANDPLSAMLFGWDDRWVQATLLRGRVARRACR